MQTWRKIVIVNEATNGPVTFRNDTRTALARPVIALIYLKIAARILPKHRRGMICRFVLKKGQITPFWLIFGGCIGVQVFRMYAVNRIPKFLEGNHARATIFINRLANGFRLRSGSFYNLFFLQGRFNDFPLQFILNGEGRRF